MNGRVCDGNNPPLVATDGIEILSGRPRATDPGGWRRQQRQPNQAVEGGPTRACRRNWHRYIGLPLSARHQQVEEDRTSNVLSHDGKLAGQTPGEPRSDRVPDWEPDQPKRIENPGRTRPADLPNRHQDCRCGSSGAHDREGGISRPVELPNLATGKVTMLLCRDSLVRLFVGYPPASRRDAGTRACLEWARPPTEMHENPVARRWGMGVGQAVSPVSERSSSGPAARNDGEDRRIACPTVLREGCRRCRVEAWRFRENTCS